VKKVMFRDGRLIIFVFSKKEKKYITRDLGEYFYPISRETEPIYSRQDYELKRH